MRKILSLLFVLLFASSFLQAVAQRNAFVWSNGTVTVISASSIDSVTFQIVDHSKIINGHRFVDLGLPSGLLWAETNIGADNPEDAGNYYAWGETETKDTYTEDNSKWYGTEHSGNLTATEDVATVNWGSGVRMPTKKEFEELLISSNCTWTWTTKNGMMGYQVVSNSNGNEIFLPAAGVRSDSYLWWLGERGFYWSSEPWPSYGDNTWSYHLHLMSAHHYANIGETRYYGLTVRAVAE